ncbi:MAG TPA: hypothetical protein PKD37_02275 [Oligoflexia bacterium]|nr:hypothetical protein [Oligoflexia bacterium]HMP26797.1 hypothetical protein [Oligoflexia bacterium]
MEDNFNNQNDQAPVAEDNLFEKFGLEVAHGEVEIGKTYPIFGMITKILNEEPGNALVEINFNIHALMTLTEPSRIEILKDRAFEPGIFLSKIVEKGSIIKVDCSTVIFGRKHNTFHA